MPNLRPAKFYITDADPEVIVEIVKRLTDLRPAGVSQMGIGFIFQPPTSAAPTSASGSIVVEMHAPIRTIAGMVADLPSAGAPKRSKVAA